MAKTRVKDVDTFISEARDRYQAGMDADQQDRSEAEFDVRFSAAIAIPNVGATSQWDEMAANLRISQRRPCLTWNRLPTFLSQIINDSRQNKPSIQITPIKDASIPTSKLFEDRIRQVQYDCNADVAYDTTAEQQTTCGRAFLRVSTEYIPGTDRLRPSIDAIGNQFSVVWDPSSVKFDQSDADWKFVVSYISRDKHKRLYPKAQVSDDNFIGWTSKNPAPQWTGVGADQNMVQMAEYWRKEYLDVSSKRPKCQIWQYVINGHEILKETKWIDDEIIPIIPVWGRQSVVDGVRRTFSLIRNARDPQRMLNTYVSNLAELVGQLPKVPWLVPMGGVPENSSQDWAAANSSPIAYLLYNIMDSEERPLPPPTRITSEPPIQAIVVGINQSIEAIKASMGIYDASLGASGNETSGIAIQRRQKESDVGNFHFPDNQSRARKVVGEILIRILPKLDGNEEILAVRDEMGKGHLVQMGTPTIDHRTGERVTHDLTEGQYGVAVSTGPSYTSSRQEAYDRDAALIQASPDLMFIIGDQLFQNDDTPGAEARAERMKRAIMMKSPGLIVDPNQQASVPQLQAQLQQAQQDAAKAHAFAQSLHEQIQTKVPELELKKYQTDTENELKKYTVDQQELTKRTLGEAQINANLGITRLEHEIEAINGKIDRQHEMAKQGLDHENAQNIAQMQIQAAQAAAQQGQEDSTNDE